jgi:hypothetical protein
MIENVCDLFLVYANENPEGFTVSLDLEPVTSGFAVAYKETQNSFGKEGLIKCLKHAIDHAGFVGGWLNSNGQLQFDSVVIAKDLNEAIDLGRENEQFSIFYIDKSVEIIM